MPIEFELNGVASAVDSEVDTPLLWVLREELGLLGTKFGCGAGLCGACTVHVDGIATRSCTLPVAAVSGRKVTTIEAFAGQHPLQQAWVEHNVPQCGYCQSGQIMTAAALLRDQANPSDETLRATMSGNICRCGTYQRIFAAIRSVADSGEVGHWQPERETAREQQPEQGQELK